MSIPQIIAIVLLVVEAIQAFRFWNETKKRTGKDLMLDAVIWSSILLWGGFWK